MYSAKRNRYGREVMVVTSVFIVLVTLSGQAPARHDANPSGLQLTADVLKTGMQLLGKQLLGKIPVVEIYLDVQGRLGSGGLGDGSIGIQFGVQLANLDDRLKHGRNDGLKQQVLLLREQVELDKRRNQLLMEQNQTIGDLLNHHIRVFKYQTEALMRKEIYTVPVDKLVVVVADFSSGNLEEGREIADEIAHHLNELKKYGIEIHVFAGEIKPGVVIRSEEMAQDLGRHLPPDTSYVVIWGTLSPRTVGWYRPHLTCVRKHGSDRGTSVSFTLDLLAEELPFKDDPQKYQRACFARLIGVTCAAIPSCYAAHEINRERTPDLGKFFTLLGETSQEVKQLQEEIQPLSRWAAVKTGGQFEYLRALTQVSLVNPYPSRIWNTRDESILTLITDADGKPQRFPSAVPGKDDIVYIDVVETTNRQFLKFLNAKGANQDEGGAKWIADPPEHWNLKRLPATNEFVLKDDSAAWIDAPIIEVSWFGAKTYGHWAGKDLPRQEEWQAAARPSGAGTYPWGQGFDQPENLCNSGLNKVHARHTTVGTFARDRSRIGCLDMAGNAAEWCEDWFDETKSKERVICGGSWMDTDPKIFEISARRGLPPVSHKQWVGFRGVVRVPVEKLATK